MNTIGNPVGFQGNQTKRSEKTRKMVGLGKDIDSLNMLKEMQMTPEVA
jgi:hypothetical protein